MGNRMTPEAAYRNAVTGGDSTMTVSTEVDHNDYTGNGTTTSFPYTFRIFNKGDLTVTVVDLSENISELVVDTDYAVTGAGGYTGGSVTLPAPLPTGYKISIAREIPLTQETDLRNQGKFFAEVHEDAFDKLTMLIQQVFSSFRLALRKPSSVANWYDALNNYIRNLRDPRDPQDAATKAYTDTADSRSLRFSSDQVVPMPPLAQMEGMLVAFSNGKPLGVLPASGSASEVMILLAAPDGSTRVGDGVGTTVHDKLIALASADYAMRNARMLGTAYMKLHKSQALKIVCQGDSVTAGHDTVSPDKIPSTTGNPATVAPIQYPLRVQDNISAFTDCPCTVINQGYSGDTARLSYERWTTNPGADVCHLMLGINDSIGAHGATFEEYADYMERLIKRYIDWGTAVVLHTTTPTYYNNANPLQSHFTQYVKSLSQRYGCPLFESECVPQFCEFQAVYSDDTHFNKAGYAKFGDAVTAFIMAGGWVGQYRRVSGYVSQQPGRSSEGIGFFSKNTVLQTNLGGSYVVNGAVAAINKTNGMTSFHFFLDCDFANVYLVGDIGGGMRISISNPVTTVGGKTAYNRWQVKGNSNCGLSETGVYQTAERNTARGAKAFAGSLVGRGWKTIFIQGIGVRASDAFLNYLIIEPTAENNIQQVADELYFNGATMHKAVDDVLIINKPYADRTTAGSDAPAVSGLGTVRIPLPPALRGYASNDFYYDTRAIQVIVKTVASTNAGLMANGLTEFIIYRDTPTTIKAEVQRKTAAACIEPVSVSLWSTDQDDTGGTATFPQPSQKGYLDLNFNSAASGYFTIEIRSPSIMSATNTWLV